MMSRSVTRAVAVGAGLLVCAVVSQGQAGPDRLTPETWQVAGVERTALVASPQGVAPRTGAPLVLVFHGHGGSSQNAVRTFRIHQYWPEAIVVYPQGLPTPGRLTDPEGRRAGWQSAPGEQTDRDLMLTDAMLTWARQKWTVDPARVFAAGHSNGGSMTYVLWAARPDAFAAFAPSSSIFPRDLIGGATPKPAFIVAGEKDALVNFAGQRLSLAAVLRLNQAGIGAPWEGRASLHASPIGADVVAYVHPGGHTMPTDTGELIVRFFKARQSKGTAPRRSRPDSD